MTLVVAEADDVADDVIPGVNEGHVTADRHILVVSRSGAQLAAEAAGHVVGAPLHVAIVWLAGLEPPIPLGCEPILGAQACGRMGLVLAVPALGDLPVVFVELLLVLVVSILCRGTAGEEKRDGESC